MNLSLEQVKIWIKRFWPWALGVGLMITLVISWASQLGNGVIKVLSVPVSSRVYVNGIDKGQTPLEASFPTGTYNVSVASGGYLTETKVAKVTKGNSTQIEFALTKSPVPQTIVSDRTSDIVVSGDGKILYSLLTSQRDRELWSYDPITARKVKLLGADRLRIDKTHWFKDGRAQITDTDGGNWLYSSGSLSKLSFRGYGISWSPKGDELAFANDRFFDPKIPEGINIYNLKSSQITNVVSDNSVTGKQTSWSPDGTKIMYYSTSVEGSELAGQLGNVSIVNRNGSAKIAVVLITAAADDIIWASDSLNLYYSSSTQVYKQGIDNKIASETLEFGSSGLSLSANSNLGVTVASRKTGRVWYLIDGSLKQLRESQSPDSAIQVAAYGTVFAISSSKELQAFQF